MVPPYTYVHESHNDHAGPLEADQSGVPSHMHTPCGPIKAIAWSAGYFQSIRNWHVRRVFLHDSEWESPQTELVSFSTYNNHHLRYMAPIVVGPLLGPWELLCVCALIWWWPGCTYIEKARLKKVGQPEWPPDCQVYLSKQQELLRYWGVANRFLPWDLMETERQKGSLGHSEPFGNTSRFQRIGGMAWVPLALKYLVYSI